MNSVNESGVYLKFWSWTVGAEALVSPEMPCSMMEENARSCNIFVVALETKTLKLLEGIEAAVEWV